MKSSVQVECIRARVQAARDIQTKHFLNNGSTDIVCNADMLVGEIRRFCKLQDEGQSLMREAMTQLNLLARAYHHILLEASAHNRGLSWVWGNPIPAFGGGTTIPSRVDVELIYNKPKETSGHVSAGSKTSAERRRACCRALFVLAHFQLGFLS